MDINDIFKNGEDENISIDWKSYLTHLLSYHLINQQYLKAILEAQVDIMAKLHDNPDVDIKKHLKIIEDKIDKASDEEFIEAMQRIIKKD